MQFVNKVIITPEAVFDYEEAVIGRRLDRVMLKQELEEYIDRMNSRLIAVCYFRCKFMDEATGELLMLFIYRGSRQRVLQNWVVRGICAAKDWDEDVEYYGDIKNWVDSKITEYANSSDWVIRLRVREEEQQRLIALAEKERVND